MVIKIHLHNGKIATVNGKLDVIATKQSIDAAMQQGWSNKTIGYICGNEQLIIPTNAVEAIYIED